MAGIYWIGAFLSLLVTATSGAPVDNGTLTNNLRMDFEANSTIRVSPFSLRHMEIDLYHGDGEFMLVAWGNAIITTTMKGFQDVRTVVGSIEHAGYAEGAGGEARFNLIASFLQLNKTHVVISDWKNSCLRMLDRQAGKTSPFAGKCGQRGAIVDGNALDSVFDLPRDVMFDERDHTRLIILDDYNDAVRMLDMNTMKMSTLYVNDTTLRRPSYGVFDMKDNNIMYITIKRRVVMFNLKEQSVTLLTGSVPDDSVKKYVYDGPFSSAIFGYYLSGIVQISPQFLLVSDYWANKVRVIDLYNQQVYSVCDNKVVQVFGAANGENQDLCDIFSPHALFYRNNQLYIGETARIAVKQVAITEGGKPQIIGNYSAAIDGDVHCVSSLSGTVGIDEKTTEVKVGDGSKLDLPPGEYNYTYATSKGVMCTVTITITKILDSSMCIPSVDRVASQDTHTAWVDLTFTGISQFIELPIGQHPYHLRTDGMACNMTINVYDPSLLRVVEFEVRYDYDCDRLNDSAALSLTMSTARHNAVYLNEVCGNACTVQRGDEGMRLTCNNSTLTLTYPSDVIFSGDVKKIPERLGGRITQSLVAKGIMMSLVDTMSIPPVIFPTLTPEGSSASLTLTSFCDGGKQYDSARDTCVKTN